MRLFKSVADKLVYKIDRYTKNRKKVIDNKNVTNSKLANRIKALEYKTWQNQVTADSKVYELDRLISKANRDLQSAKDYVNSVQPTDQKPMNITGKRGM